jgi:hypothetical protein
MHIIIAILSGYYLMIILLKMIECSFIVASFLLGLLFSIILKSYRKYRVYRMSKLIKDEYTERKKKFVRDLRLVE